MLEDTFEGLEDDDVEELADSEVEKVLFEVTSGKNNDRVTSGKNNDSCLKSPVVRIMTAV